jgi:hypothetical protein
MKTLTKQDIYSLSLTECRQLIDIQHRRIVEQRNTIQDKDSALQAASDNIDAKQKIIDNLSYQLADRPLRCGRL